MNQATGITSCAINLRACKTVLRSGLTLVVNVEAYTHGTDCEDFSFLSAIMNKRNYTLCKLTPPDLPGMRSYNQNFLTCQKVKTMKKKLAVFSLEKKRNIYGDDDYYVLGSLESILPITPNIEDTIENMNISEGEIIVVLPIYTKD